MALQLPLRTAGNHTRAPGPVTFSQVITPDEAARMLTEMRYEHQRPIREARVRAYTSEMTAGMFRDLTQIFIAVYRGRHFVLDGQHRLQAVVNSGVPILFSIVEQDVNSEEEMAHIYSTTDIGGRRTPSDIYGAYDLGTTFNLTKTHLDRFGAAIRFMYSGCLRTSGNTPTSPDIVIAGMRLYAPFMQVYRDIMAGVALGESMSGPALRASTIAAAILTIRFSLPKAERDGKPSVRAFWTGALQDDGLKIGDPRKAAYRHLNETRLQTSNNSRHSQTTRPAYSIRYIGGCLNAYIGGRDLKYPKVFDETLPLDIYGIPSDTDRWW